MFKFKKGDKVVIEIGKMFITTFGGPVNTTTTEPSEINDCREHCGTAQYKVKGFTGWWDESSLTMVKQKETNYYD